MSYAILRTKKLKMGNAAASLMHTFRERDTPNADPDRAGENSHLYSKSTDEAMGRMRNLLPDKRRKDAVVAIEYLMATSPEWAQNKSIDEQKKLWNRSLDWIKKKHGEENIISASVHLDETTPHQVIYVVPRTADGRLCAKDFLGGRQKLRDMQTDYAETVKDLGLERGIEGSKARHQKIQTHYANLNKPIVGIKVGVKIDDLRPRHDPRSGFEEPDKMAERITSEQVERLRPQIGPVIARARDADELLKKNKLLTQQVNELRKSSIKWQAIESSLPPDELERLNKSLESIKPKQSTTPRQKIKQESVPKPKGPRL